jgi:hypothetical protein
VRVQWPRGVSPRRGSWSRMEWRRRGGGGGTACCGRAPRRSVLPSSGCPHRLLCCSLLCPVCLSVALALARRSVTLPAVAESAAPPLLPATTRGAHAAHRNTNRACIQVPCMPLHSPSPALLLSSRALLRAAARSAVAAKTRFLREIALRRWFLREHDRPKRRLHGAKWEQMTKYHSILTVDASSNG